MKIVDAHHHLWDLTHLYYPWLSDRIRKVVFGEYGAIRRNYVLRDFLADAREVNLIKSVHIQADCDPGQAVAETEWLQRIGDEIDAGGFPHAIVAYADLSKDDARTILAQHCRSRNVRGIRQMLHHVRMSDSTVSGIEYLTHPIWLQNLDLLREYGLSFDLHLLPEQIPQAVRVVEKHPDIQFILCHTGNPYRRDPPGLEGWREGLRLLADQPNTSIKISGLGMFDRAWTVDSIRPLVRAVIEIFGAHRCMFASNFPVDSLASSYTSLWKAFDEITSDLDVDAREGLFVRNAERIYRI